MKNIFSLLSNKPTPAALVAAPAFEKNLSLLQVGDLPITEHDKATMRDLIAANEAGEPLGYKLAARLAVLEARHLAIGDESFFKLLNDYR